MRLSFHAGRTSSGKAFNVNHLDRRFESCQDTHIDRDRTPGNIYWITPVDGDGHLHEKPGFISKTLRQSELDNYEKFFGDYLAEFNNNQIAASLPNRCKTMEEYYSSPRHCPDEVIIQIGNQEDKYSDNGMFKRIFEDFVKWHEETFTHVKILSAALHVDEASPHIHMRRIYLGIDPKTGLPSAYQHGALEADGVRLPHPDQKRGQFNNLKVTYTDICRHKLQELAIERGIDLDIVPITPSKKHKEKLEYENEREQQKLEEKLAEKKQLSEEIDKLINGYNYLIEQIKDLNEQRLDLAEKIVEQSRYDRDREERSR